MEIKAQQFIKEPNISSLKNTVVIYGNDTLLKEMVIDKFKEYDDFLIFWGDELKFDDFVSNIKVQSLFGKKPSVIVRDASSFFSSLSKEQLSLVLKYLSEMKNQKVILTFKEEELPKSEFYKKLLEIVDIIICPKLTKQAFISSLKKKLEREGIDIDDKDLEYLSSLLNYDLTVAKPEVEKLISYCKDKGKILREDIDNLVVSVSENTVFEFIDSLFRKDISAVSIAKRLIEKDFHPFQIQTMIINQIEKIFYFKVLISTGLSPEEAFNRLKIQSNIQKINIQKFSKLLSIDELKRIVNLTYQLEINQKVYYKDIEKEFINFVIFVVGGYSFEHQT